MDKIDRYNRVVTVISWLQRVGRVKTMAELGSEMGMNSGSYLSRLMTNDPIYVKDKTLESLAAVDPRINLEWLKTGEGEMLREFVRNGPFNRSDKKGVTQSKIFTSMTREELERMYLQSMKTVSVLTDRCEALIEENNSLRADAQSRMIEQKRKASV